VLVDASLRTDASWAWAGALPLEPAAAAAVPGLSLIVSNFASFGGFLVLCFLGGGLPKISPDGLFGYCPLGSWSNSQGTPFMILMFLGNAAYPEWLEGFVEGGGFVLQLVLDTLVAVVDTLLTLELLYLVNADVDVPALDVVLIELRQFEETTELALEARGRPLLVLFGDTARSFLLST